MKYHMSLVPRELYFPSALHALGKYNPLWKYNAWQSTEMWYFVTVPVNICIILSFLCTSSLTDVLVLHRGYADQSGEFATGAHPLHAQDVRHAGTLRIRVQRGGAEALPGDQSPRSAAPVLSRGVPSPQDSIIASSHHDFCREKVKMLPRTKVRIQQFL